MKQLICTALALGAMTAVAAAEPAKLSDAQMAKVTAGAVVSTITPVAVLVQVSPAVSVAVGVFGSASSSATSFNTGSIKQIVVFPGF